jgi:nucleotide-binding universal stress UspA family protein
MSQKIVVGYDGSPEADLAARWALDEARRTGHPVELVYAWAYPAYMPAASLVPGIATWPGDEARAAARARLSTAVTEARTSHPGVDVGSVILDGPPALVLRDRAEHAGLLVVGGRSHGAFAGAVLGSVSGAVAAHAARSVVVVRDTRRNLHVRPVVAGLDESDIADLVAGFAFDQAAGRGVPLHVVRAWMPPVDPLTGFELERDAVTAAEQASVAAVLAGWREKFPQVPVSTSVVVGHPYEVLGEAAETAQLMVVGARGRGGFPSLRVGSVSRHLLNHTGSTIAIVRDPATSNR